MSQVSGKQDSIKGKIEKTSSGVKVMGSNAQSSAQSKKDYARKNSRTPTRKRYKSSTRSQGTRDSPVFEDVSHEISSADEEADVEASAPQTEVPVSNVPDKENSPSLDSSSESKNSEPENEAHEEVSSEESTKSPPSVHEISDADDSDDVPLASVAARMKKRRRVLVEDTPSGSQKKAKSTMDVKSKGKQKVVDSSHKKVKKTAEKKKIPRIDWESESDVEVDVQDIRTSEKKKFSGKRIPSDVPSFPIDNVSFHAAENVLKWKYVCNRRIAKEREIGKDVLECKMIVALIDRAGLRKTVMDIGKCYEKLVKEFLVNLTDDVGIPGSVEFRKVYVRGKCVTFSPAVINQALGRSDVEFVEEELSLDKVAKELTTGQVKKWPAKKLLSTGLLSVKYAILNRIGVVNWIPSHHTSAVSAILAKLIYRIGTEVPFDFGSLVFAQTLKHAETCAVKLPISFPSLLTAIILKQHPDILRMDDVAFPKGTPITLDHRLFLDPHVLDIDMPSRRTSIPVSMSASGTQSVIAELEDLSKELQVSIKVATERKLKVDTLIAKLKEEAGHEGESRSDAVEEEGSEEEESSSEA
ncbi:uncharacterized protein LOC130744199 [Lotus japonicus]|uniref:uncharacterized protein LOC130744199 n=1 Tax=Lotus japonicus TaxID=34305 RepID=UPI002583DF7B|nr:uncharacterized protein LOC130744199 [Lotus japonicus]